MAEAYTGTSSAKFTHTSFSGLPGWNYIPEPEGRLNNDGLHSYEYDSEGKLCRLDNGAIVMTYDAFGRWVER